MQKHSTCIRMPGARVGPLHVTTLNLDSKFFCVLRV